MHKPTHELQAMIEELQKRVGRLEKNLSGNKNGDSKQPEKSKKELEPKSDSKPKNTPSDVNIPKRQIIPSDQEIDTLNQYLDPKKGE